MNPQLHQPSETPELDVVRIVSLNEDKQVLLVQEVDDKSWKLPGGKIHAGETILEAIQREVAEELGVDVTEAQITKYVKALIPHTENFRHIVSINIPLETIKKTDEVAQFGYYDVNQLPYSKFKEHIQTACALLEQ